MPDPSMNVSAAPTPPLPPPPATASPLGLPAEASGGGLDAALERLLESQAADVDTLHPGPGLLTNELVAAYLENRAAGVDELLSTHPGALAALSTMSAEELEQEVEAALSVQQPGMLGAMMRGMRSAAIGHSVERYLESAIRGAVYREAQRNTQDVIGELRMMGADLPATVDRLRRAEAGSDEAVMAASLGIRGDDSDAWRAERGIERALQNLSEFAEFLQSPSLWDIGDFPNATFHAVQKLELGTPLVGTLAHDAIFEAGGDPREIAESLFNLATTHALRAFTAGTGAGGAISMLVGNVLQRFEYEIEARQARMAEAGEALGL